jgi:hypothetical protein
MKTVEQGVLFALDKASTPQAKRDPEDVEENFDIYMHNSDGDDEDDDDEVPQPRLAGRKKPGKRSVAENTFNVKRSIFPSAFSLISSLSIC